MIVYTYRYVWKIEGSSTLNFKIVSDIDEGFKLFEKELLSLPGIERCAKEYLHEYDCTKIGKFDTLLGGDSNEKK